MNGPVNPSMVKRALGSDTTILGAILSELASNNLVKITHTKMGGSPFYYVQGQEPKLESIQQYLGEKDRRTILLLKNERVLMDRSQDPLIRVSLRNTKDFAQPFQKEHQGRNELFWKYYLATDEEVAGFQERLQKKVTPVQTVAPVIEEKPVVRQEPISKPLPPVQPELRVSQPVHVVEVEDTFIQPVQAGEEKPAKKEVPKQETLVPKKKVEESTFWNELESYFKKNKVRVMEQKIIRKNSEYDLVVEFPSAVGTLTYFCKAKKKKRISDGDLSTFFFQASGRKLPALYLTTGELTKKAKELLATELKSITVKQL